MGSIIEEALRDIASVTSGFEEVMQPVSDVANGLRDFLLEQDFIHKYADPENFDAPTLATIDGACITNQLSHFDMIISGATLGEGTRSENLFTEDNYPSTTFLSLLQHDSGNKDVARALMAAQEVSLLDHAPHMVRVMDGSWLSSATSLVLTFSRNAAGSQLILEYLLKQRTAEGWDGFEIVRGLERIFAPWLQSELSPHEIIALSKSDSSHVISRRIGAMLPSESQLAKSFKAVGFMDRLLASIVLDSGEMLTPTYIDAGRSLYPRINSDDMRGITKAKNALKENLSGWEQKFYGISDISGLDRKTRAARARYLDDVVGQMLVSGYLSPLDGQSADSRSIQERVKSLDSAEGVWIWSTYFKPHVFSRRDKALRMEFARDMCAEDDTETLFRPEHYLPETQIKASYLCALISGDMISSEILEPWSQYIADRRAKEVSSLSDVVTNHMIATVDDDLLLDGIWRNYRT